MKPKTATVATPEKTLTITAGDLQALTELHHCASWMLEAFAPSAGDSALSRMGVRTVRNDVEKAKMVLDKLTKQSDEGDGEGGEDDNDADDADDADDEGDEEQVEGQLI